MASNKASTKVAQAKLPKTKYVTKLKKPADHPKYSEMIKDAVTALKERGGSSRQAILKYIVTNYNIVNGTTTVNNRLKLLKDMKTVNNHLKLALKAGLKFGRLNQSKGSGASGSFKLVNVKAEKKPKTSATKKTTTVSKFHGKKNVKTTQNVKKSNLTDSIKAKTKKTAKNENVSKSSNKSKQRASTSKVKDSKSKKSKQKEEKPKKASKPKKGEKPRPMKNAKRNTSSKSKKTVNTKEVGKAKPVTKSKIKSAKK